VITPVFKRALYYIDDCTVQNAALKVFFFSKKKYGKEMAENNSEEFVIYYMEGIFIFG